MNGDVKARIQHNQSGSTLPEEVDDEEKGYVMQTAFVASDFHDGNQLAAAWLTE
jgi:hypothetical protein